MNFNIISHKGNRLHETLYDNIRLLTLIHPPRKEFLEVFIKDMFAKNNKAAFFEVAYYLLNILSPELTSQNLPSWPPYDIKTENKFRMELLTYINNLNSIYDNSDIPHIMASQLISPGGIRFVKFMLKLSQLVVYKELTSTNCYILNSIKICKEKKHTQIIIHNMQCKVKEINKNSNKLNREFNEHFKKSKKEAEDITNQQKMLNKQIAEAKLKYATLKQDFEKKFTPYPSMEDLLIKFSQLQENFKEIFKVKTKFEEVLSNQEIFLSDDRILKHDKKKLKVPNDIVHIINNGDQLDLQQYFHGLFVLLQKKSFNLSIPPLSYVSKLKEHTDMENDQLKKINEDCSEKLKKLTVSLERVQKLFYVDTIIINKSSLAVPLYESFISK